MRRPVLHQFIAGASPGDAITDLALLLRRWLREDGFRSELFAESVHPSLHAEVRTYLAYRPARPGETVVVHHSIGTALVEHLLSLDVRLLLIYHNVTPAIFFRDLDPALAVQAQRGRRQLAQMRERTLLGLGVSRYDERELCQAGFSPTAVLPLPLEEHLYRLEPNPALVERFAGGAPNLLFVGRLAPNKRQEDLVKLLCTYRRIAPSARLFLVGSPWAPGYAGWVRDLAQGLGVGEAVVFAGHVSQQDLVTYYRLADVYVSMSEHEGLGKPLIESMRLGVPVMAYAAAAVPETLGGAGVLFHHKAYEGLAEMVDLLLRDAGLRERIVARQHARAQAFLEPAVRQIWEKHLALCR